MSDDGVRIEEDSLGHVRLPQTALYGVRTWRCVENLSFSRLLLSECPAMIEALTQVKKASALANHRCGVIDEKRRDAIVGACDELLAGKHREQFVVDLYAGGGSIALNSNINEVLANLANERLGAPRGTYAPVHPKDHVNASQSTADACHTAMNLAIMREWEALDTSLRTLSDVAHDKAVEMGDVKIIARTCLQDAMVARLGDTFAAIATMVRRRREELAHSIAKLREVNLGGTVIGSGEGAPRRYREAALAALRSVSGRDVVLATDFYDAAQNIDGVAAVSAELASLAGALMKVCKDLRLMASGPHAGFGEIVLPAVQEGSSFFKGKVNPVVPETLLQCCFLVLGNDRAVHATLEHGELNLNVFEGAAGAVILESIGYLTRALNVFIERCFRGIEASKSRSPQYEETLARLDAAAAAQQR